MKIPHECGKIIIPYGALPKDTELEVADLLICTGHNVKFLPVRTTKSPDIKFKNYEWEIKSPIGKSSRTIENCLRHAIKQSPNVILDLRHINIPEEKCFTYLQTHIVNFHGLKKLIIITRSHELFTFSSKNRSKNSCLTKLCMLQ